MNNRVEKLKDNYLLLVVMALFLLGKIGLWDIYFFWDSTATLSKPAHFLYENNFSSIIFPDNFVDDNVALSALVAFYWKIVGRSIFSTHIFFSIIGIVLIYQSYKMCKIFVPDHQIFPYLFLLFISDTALVTQSLLFMTDTVMVLFAIMSIRYMLENKKWAFALSILGLSLLRARGVFMCAGIGLSYFIYLLYQNNWKSPFKLLKQAVIPFLPCIIVIIAFLVYKSVLTGSLVYYFREDTPWSGHYQMAGIKQLMINVATAGRFFLDYGRIFLWILLFYIIVKVGIKTIAEVKNISVPCIIFGSTLCCLLFVTLPITNAFGFRYFILQYMLVALISGLLLFRFIERKKAKMICIGLIIGLWSGHGWIYPDKVSGGWDTMLAHIPYYQLRRDALNYLENNHIDFQSVGFFFPATSQGKYIELNDDERVFATFDLETNQYVAFSNIANWDDETIDEVTSHWILVKAFEKNRVFIRIYKNPMLNLN